MFLNPDGRLRIRRLHSKQSRHILKGIVLFFLALNAGVAFNLVSLQRGPSANKVYSDTHSVAFVTSEGQPPLKDRVFLVTGSTDGIGKVTVELLAKAGCTVLVHGRSASKVSNVVQELKQYNPKIYCFVADLSNMEDVRNFATNVKEKFQVLHGLANNAGTFAGDYTFSRRETSEGNEYSLAVNVMAPFLLTSMLLENIRASGAGRVLITSSISAGSNEKLADIQCKENWSDHTAYELSKLCDAMIAMECHARYADPPRLTFHTMDPGTVNTKMLRAGWVGGSPIETATTTFEMLTQDRFQASSGSGEVYCRGEGPDARAWLWEQLEDLTGAKWP